MLQRNLLYTGVTRGKRLVGRAEEGGRHRGPQRVGAEAVVEAQRVAAAKTACLTKVRHGELSHGRRGLFAGSPRSGGGSMASSRPGRCSLPRFAGRTVGMKRSAASRANSSTAT